MRYLSLLVTALVFSLSTMTTVPAADKKVTVGGGPIGGTYYVLATGFAKILNEDVGGLSASVEVGAGSSHNVQLVSLGQTDFGITNGSVLMAGMQGEGWAKGKKYANGRMLFGMQLSYIHFWTPKETGIAKLRDLNGKIVNLSKKGSGADITGRKIFKLLGIKPKKITNLGHTDANQAMQDGLIHASLTAGGLPHPAVAALSSTRPVVQFGVTGADAKNFLKANPALSLADIPANTYKGQTKPVPTVGDWNVMIVNKSMPDDEVYKVVKATFANIPKWTSVHKSAKTTKPENIKDLRQYPMHPGAARYYKEKGLN